MIIFQFYVELGFWGFGAGVCGLMPVSDADRLRPLLSGDVAYVFYTFDGCAQGCGGRARQYGRADGEYAAVVRVRRDYVVVVPQLCVRFSGVGVGAVVAWWPGGGGGLFLAAAILVGNWLRMSACRMRKVASVIPW